MTTKITVLIFNDDYSNNNNKNNMRKHTNV